MSALAPRGLPEGERGRALHCRMSRGQKRSGRLRHMDRHTIKVRLTPAARELLRPGEALVLEWHRLAICCAGAGEMSLSVAKEETTRKRKGLVREDRYRRRGRGRSAGLRRPGHLPARGGEGDRGRRP